MDLTLAIILFLISSLVIAVTGTILTKTADALADVTGMGEAIHINKTY